MQRTTVLARRERQFFADAGSASLRDDVIFELIAEVPHRCQHRVRRRLAQPAQRALADVAAQLVQHVHVPSVPAPSVIAFRMRRHLFSPTRHGMHLPHDSECVNSMKYRATSTMQLSSSITTMPPEPMIDPSCARLS